MATIGVLTYTLPPNLKVKSNLNKIATNNTNNNNGNNNNNNNNNTNNFNNNNFNNIHNNMTNINQNAVFTKVENNTIIDNGILILKKKQKMLPLTESTAVNVQQKFENSLKRPRLSEPCNQHISSTPIQRIELGSVTIGKKVSTPQPQAVARRNARERNRVKQVNNGFAALRQHIPEEVAESFEAAGNGRGSSKKLSKVETLRMAVEYIHILERLLEIDPSQQATTVSPPTPDSSTCGSDISFATTASGATTNLQSPTSVAMASSMAIPTLATSMRINSLSPINSMPPTLQPMPMADNPQTVIKTESCSPSIDEHYPESNYDDPEETAMYFADTLPDITTLNGQQYVRIPGTNTYQLIMSDLIENEENIQPIPVIGGYSGIGLDAHQHEYASVALSADEFPPIIPPATTSPSSQSHNGFPSLSPAYAGFIQQHAVQLMPSLQMNLSTHVKNPEASQHFQYHLAANSTPLGAGGYSDGQLYDGVIMVRQKIKEENIALESTAPLSEDSMMDAIDWWDSQTPQSDESAIA